MKKPTRTHNLKSRKHLRRQLRNNATTAEKKLWSMLQSKQLQGRRFRRQYSIGPFIVDFYCPDEQLAIEVDGSIHDDPFRYDYDNERQQYLEKQGIRVIRFTNEEVFDDPDTVAQGIAYHFREGTDHQDRQDDQPPESPPIQGDS